MEICKDGSKMERVIAGALDRLNPNRHEVTFGVSARMEDWWVDLELRRVIGDSARWRFHKEWSSEHARPFWEVTVMRF